MNKYLLALSLIFFSSVQAAPLTLDFTSGAYGIDEKTQLFDTYSQDGFTLTKEKDGNHLDKNLEQLSNIGFHNGIGNVISDNNLVLTYTGGTFDLTNIDLKIFVYGVKSLDLTGSNGTMVSLDINDIGINSLPFLNITSVIFSITDDFSGAGAGGVGWDSLVVNTTPSTVPVPAAVWLFGSGLIGLFRMRKKVPPMSV